ncbi:amidohydrolase family protein [Leptobacterium flavescens]|uniref:Amidohydrolase family protein n=1 Tax=Leptobacterium flavescens TaxID=472055 RepID=A0A6P0UPM6_9FLAO|nr:amidohydrolase [Leptobacterium flavescens]NER15294.1 amidohydrolase family protein [Leptobacterium flavescens]
MKRYILLLSVLIFSCNTKQEADMIVINANAYTVDADFGKAEAFAIKDGKFLKIGTTQEIVDNYTAAEVIDVDGKTVVPGLIDAHCHFYGLGLNMQVVDLMGTTSYDDVLEKVVAFQEEKQAPFITGRGWDQNDWEVKEFPTKDRLDELFPDTPVALKRVDGHAYLVNQKALDMAGITAATKIAGGEVELKDGKPTGILIDNPMRLVDAVIPAPDMQTSIQALMDAQKTCFDYGLTTVNDAGLNKSTIELIDSLQNAGDLKMRVYAMISNNKENLDYYLKEGVIKTEKLNVRSVKVYGDGALGSRGAALKEPYSDKEGHFGALVTSVADVQALAERIAASDYQMNTHAIGDSANAVILRTYMEVLKDKGDRRWKIEHAQVVDLDDFDAFSNGIIPSVQPTHATSDMYWAEDRVGPDRIKGAYAFKKLLNKAGTVALGTDFPVERVSPFLTFYAAVARQDLENYPEGGFLPEEALSREETLKGMTIWAAYSNFEEDEKGSIEEGKFADFIVLDRDIMTVPVNEIPEVEVKETFIGGVKVK